MTVSAQEAIETVLIGLLRNGSPLWGVRVQAADIVSSTVERPYLHYFPASDMQPASNPHHKRAEMVYSIKGVAEDKATALAIREAITTLLDDSGDQDINPRLPYHAGWRVTTVSTDRAIWLQEYPAAGKTLYHAGHQYMIRMERR
jgi:hypothetical protein